MSGVPRMLDDFRVQPADYVFRRAGCRDHALPAPVSKSLSPASATVGTSGIEATRLELETAMSFSLPISHADTSRACR